MRESSNSRLKRLPQATAGNRANLQLVEKRKPEPPPSTPAPSVWVPRCDKQGIVNAFSNGVSLHQLSGRQRRPLRVIESVLRERIDELEGRIRSMSAGELRRAA
jgi:hypothetical protein